MAIFQRRKTHTANVGGVRIGSDAPIAVQSMTNTDTADIPGTIQQVAALARAGSELVRVTVNNDDAAAALPYIHEGLQKLGVNVPIIGDFHYNGHLLLKKYPACARALAKYRINPGNVSIGRKDDNNFGAMIEVRGGESEAGPHWRELGIARPGAADSHDGRKLASGRAERSARRDDGSDGGERAEVGGDCREVRHASGPDHSQRQG